MAKACSQSLLKAGEGGGVVIVDHKQLVELGDHKDLVNLRVNVRKTELAALLLDVVVNGDQRPQRGRGQVLDILEVQQNLWIGRSENQRTDLVTDLLDAGFFKDISVQEANGCDFAVLINHQTRFLTGHLGMLHKGLNPRKLAAAPRSVKRCDTLGIDTDDTANRLVALIRYVIQARSQTMNASYKIVLLGAFVVFAAVVGYYIFSGDTKTPDDLALNDQYPEESTDRVVDPDPRTTLETAPPVVEPEPEPVVDPAFEETIGETVEELPDPPVIDPDLAEGPIARIDPSEEFIRPAPETSGEPITEDPATPVEEAIDPALEPRPAPELGEGDPIEEITDPEPEIEPAPRPIPPDPATIPRTYKVQAGDTFASIAKEYYGEERAWFDIAQANPSVDPKRLQVGQEIVLPNRDTTVREREEVQPPAPGRDQSYTVRPGDNLSKIAKRFYGDSEKWDLIYARNRQLIGQRPDALKVGMELVIPQAYEGAE